MENLILITAHCLTYEQEKKLENCIDSVLILNYHVALISHTHISPHIQKKCEYYFYDHLNDVSDNYNFLEHENFSFDNKIIQSRFFQKYFYGFAIYRMFSIGSQIAINFGYQNLHHIEYDCEILDQNLIRENAEHLDIYDSVIYTDNGKEDGFLFGSFKSFKVKSLPEEFKTYNKEFITEEMMKRNPKNLETVSKHLFLNSGKVLIKNENELTQSKFSKGVKFYGRNLHYTLYYDPKDGNLYIFYKSFKQIEEKICVLVNNQRAVNIDVSPNRWYIRPLGIFDEIHFIRVDNSERIIYNLAFDENFRDIFKNKSYISEVR